jgi:tetratricopeptide (TPR) repeat protein
MHARVAEALERRAGENADEAAALLSLHFEWAQEHERAWRYSVIAGKRAQAGFANVDAVELYSRALAVGEEAGATDAELAEVAEALGDVAEIAARFVEAADAYGRARKLVGDDMLALTRLLRKEGVVRERLGRYSEALRWYGRALKALDRVDDEAASANRVELELAYAGVKHRQGRFADAVEWGTRAAEHAEAIESRSAVAHAYYLLDLAYSRLGQRDNPYRGLSLAIYEETADLWGQTRVLNNLGVDAYYEGRWDDSLDYYRRCGEIADRAGDVILLATATNNIAEIQSDQGLLEEAREGFEEALRVFRAAQYRMGAAIVTSNLGRVAARAGRFDEAHTLLEDALAEVQELGADALVAETRARLAECLVLEGRYREATATLAPLLAEGGGPMVERLAGYAVVQSRAPFAKAKPHFDAALEAARTADAQYELALTLRAVAETSGADAKEAAAILERLGVVSTPSVPLP